MSTDVPTSPAVPALSREDVLGFRLRAQQLHRTRGTVEDTAVLDLGVQDTGPDGSLWALANRGVDVAHLDPDATVLAWTLRGAPHLYRRADLPSVAAAVAPFSDADAAKRIYDAAGPLRAAGTGTIEALDAVAAAMRAVVTGPMVKGEVSRRVTDAVPAPYLRECRPCRAVHLHEMPFRLAALRAGLELEPGTSPPVLRPVPGLRPDPAPQPRHDVVRAHLRLLGPATPKTVAAYLDAPLEDVRARWPDDAVEVLVEGQRSWALAEDADALARGPEPVTRLLGPYDPYVQTKDRALLVGDPGRAKELWRVLGRPGGVLLDGELAGTWRARQAGARRLAVTVELWTPPSPSAREQVEEQAERLAAFRGAPLDRVAVTG